MKWRRAIRLGTVLWATIVSSADHGFGAEGELHRFPGKPAEFTIDLPAEWKDMDPQLLEALVDPYSQDDLPAQGRTARYGYSPGTSGGLTNPPYLMVEVRRTGRIPDRLMALQSNDDFLRRTISEHLTKAGILERNILEANYDSNRLMVRFGFTRIEPFARQELRIAQSVFFTEEGSINLMAVCPKQDWDAWSNKIDRAIATVQVAPNLRYRPHAPAKIPSSGTLAIEFLTVIGMVLGAGIVYVIYLRKKDSVMSNEV